MELLFVTVIAAGIGAVLHYALPKRNAYGVFVLPAASAIAAAVVWVGTLWALGWTFDGTWIWVAALSAGFAAALALAIALPRRRARHDSALLQELAGGKV